MSSANDNTNDVRGVRGVRGVRAGWEKKWAVTNFEAITSDEALLRLAEARNSASKAANRFMLLAALVSALYFVKLQGLTSGYEVAGYDLEKLPFGLFILAASALTLSSSSLIRTGDSRSYDRTLMLACEKRYECDCDLRYLAFPNEHAWGEHFARMIAVIEAGTLAKMVRELSLFSTALFLFALAILPALSGLDFLVGGRAWTNQSFTAIQVGIVGFLLVANISILLATFWARLSDRN